MEITCQSCSTAFIIDISVTPEEVVEVVCPGCFQLHKVRVPALPGRKDEPHHAPGGVSLESVAERLREGFTLFFEVRHPHRPETHRLSPYAIQQQIYAGVMDGTEEFREHQGRWFPIGEHPEFGRLFQLMGRTVTTQSEDQDGGARRFAGWKGVPVQEALSAPGAAPAPMSGTSGTPAPVMSPASPTASDVRPAVVSRTSPPVAQPPSDVRTQPRRTGLYLGLALLLLAALVGWYLS